MSEKQSSHSADFGEFLSGIGRTIQDSINTALEGRGNVLMVRINDDSLRAIDDLIEARLFRTRSEAAAFLILEGIRARADIFEQIHETVGRISELREQLRTTVMSSEEYKKSKAPDAEAAPAPVPAESAQQPGETPPGPVA